MMLEEVWMQAKEAKDYYGISMNTLHNWRRKGRLIVKKDDSNDRGGYLYLKQQSLRDTILNMKQFDNRWS